MAGIIFHRTDEENHDIRKETSDGYPHRPQTSSNLYLTSTKTVSTQGVYPL